VSKDDRTVEVASGAVVATMAGFEWEQEKRKRPALIFPLIFYCFFSYNTYKI
jgi:predicted membrane-bound mannosyltransferase